MESDDDVEAGLESVHGSSRLTGREALKTHVIVVLGLAFCTVAFWFELGRALRGNALSWAYVFEWPLLGIFAIYMWWKLLHPGTSLRQRAREQKPVAPEYEGMLAAWQEEQRNLEVARVEEATALQRQREMDDAQKTSDS